MTEFNNENMKGLSDSIIRALHVCLKNKDIWKNKKLEMIRLVQEDNIEFYEKYPRICRMLVHTDDISPLINMIKTFSEVQVGKMQLDTANDLITNKLNSTYIDDVLESEPLVKRKRG